MKFKPPDLPTNPTPEQWRWWKACFTDGLTINGITEAAHKLTFLRSQAGAELYAILEGATTFDEAITILDGQFKRPTRVVYARHQLLTCTQKPDETVNDFMKRLKILVHHCECKDVLSNAHQDLLLRDALVAGLTSDNIRARLLELDDTKAELADCISLANAVEISTNYSRSFHSDAGGSTVAAVDTFDNTMAAAQRHNGPQGGRTGQSHTRFVDNTRGKCNFCGSSPHPRKTLPR